MLEKLIFLFAYKGIEHISRRIEQKRMREQREESKKEALYREAMERFKKYREMG
ncbi:MAG: hypothetical protein KAQ85_01455 [Thermodesulfovibrionia bacterium]|nr:hypothetical protein [Thermodesulfovibrionia bacterium]